jgi:hypothetical protein
MIGRAGVKPAPFGFEQGDIIGRVLDYQMCCFALEGDSFSLLASGDLRPQHLVQAGNMLKLLF